MGTILVVDDDPDIRDLLIFKFASRGHGVVTAGDGREGLALSATAAPDVVVVDVNMPVMGGLEMLRALRAGSEHRGVPVVLLSAMAQHDCRDAGATAGADDYIVKPFSLSDLVARVERLIPVPRGDEVGP